MGRGWVLATLEFAMPTNIHLAIKYKAAQSLKTVMGAVMDEESVVFRAISSVGLSLKL